MRPRFLLAIVFIAVAAVAEEKPIVALIRPADCLNKEGTDPCAELAKVIAHPAMQRRLAAVTFETRIAAEGEDTAIAVFDPSGREAVRWADVLQSVSGAAPHLLESRRARDANEPFVAEREWALAVLAFGDKVRGQALLEAMRASESQENRELAAIWLERIDAMREDVLTQHARDGATERVKLEAWMAIGDARLDQGRYEDAIAAYDRAVEHAPANSFSRQNALTARQRAAGLVTPVSGLGNPGAVVAGRRSLRPRALPKNVASVEYKLEGKTVATAKRAPFAAGVNFGRIPTRQVLEVIARNAAGKILSQSSVVVNERSEAFDIAFVEPTKDELSGPVDVVLSARVPRGRSLERVTVEWNGAPVARFTAPPYRTRVNVKPGEQGMLRAVLRLDDGSETEDVLLANSGGMSYESGAHIVEVPVYFDGDTPTASNVIVREAGTQRTIERVIRPADAPLLIALLIDSSESMTRHMLDVQEAAVRFVEENIEPRDRTMVVGFDTSARVMLRPSTERPLVERSILALRPRGATALYDAIVHALLQIQSPGSRKAVVVFSDGVDVSSVFSSADVAELARRAGVPIYVLSFQPPGFFDPANVYAKNELAGLSKRTGGKAFEMRSLEELSAHWSDIGADLRRQSLVIYRTSGAGAEWRPLEVSVKGRGPVRAPSGVFVTAERPR
jgi:VWFA-related protein